MILHGVIAQKNEKANERFQTSNKHYEYLNPFGSAWGWFGCWVMGICKIIFDD